MAHRNALRLLKLVNTLLDFSRLEAGRVAGDVRSPSISRALTAELAGVFRSAIERAGLTLRRRLRAAAASRSSSIARCGRRSCSTCSRTRSSSRSTGEHRGDAPVRSGPHVALEVRDTGVGIPAGRAAADLRALPPDRRRRGRAATRVRASACRSCSELAKTARWNGDGRRAMSGRGTTFVRSTVLERQRAPARRTGAPVGAARTTARTARRTPTSTRRCAGWATTIPATVRRSAQRSRAQRASSSPTTTRTCARTSPDCSVRTGRSSWSPTARRRSRRAGSAPPTWC